MDTAHDNLNEMIGDDAPLIAKNSMIWGIFLVGVVIGFVAVYLVVAHPMFAQLSQIQGQMAALETEMESLVGARNQAWETGNLLSDLRGLKNQLRDARATVRDIRSLRQDLLEESRHTAAASEALGTLVKLQEFALEQQDHTSSALRSLEEMAQIEKRLVEEHAGAPRAEETLVDLDRVRNDLKELLNLKSQLAENGTDLATAKSTAGELLSLKDQIVSKGQDTEQAHTTANRLFVLQNELRTQGAALPDAFSNLDRLVEMKDKLVEQTPTVADAVQNLELLSDFQVEFSDQIRALGRMREGLLQIVLMEGTLGRVAKVLEPLSQIANVRRLSERELREAARTILENRSTRISSKPELPGRLPHEAVQDPFDLSPRESTGENEAGIQAGEVPPPLPLPVSQE